MTTIKTLENKIAKIKEYFIEYYGSDDFKEPLNKLNSIKKYLDAQEYKIAVVANMSSGKSTFINALFGKEVLPALHEATTDCATYIYSSKNVDKKAIIYFKNGKTLEVKESLESEIKQYAQKDSNVKEKYKNVEKIELYYPFRFLDTDVRGESNQDKGYKVVFIDTPGPNATSGEYAAKHTHQTREVLRNANMIIYLFDYGQIDAQIDFSNNDSNLSTQGDKQNLWHTISERVKDNDFEIFFILNKIDMAMEDNEKIYKDSLNGDREKELELMKKHFNANENKARQKLETAVLSMFKSDELKEKMKNRIFLISARAALVYHNENRTYDDEDYLDMLKKKFKRVFNDKNEDRMLEYIGMDLLESKMQEYINNSVKKNFSDRVIKELDSIKKIEAKRLNTQLSQLNKPKQEAQNNLKDAMEYLDSIKQMQYDAIKEKYASYAYSNIESLVDEWIKKCFYNEVENIAIGFIAYLQSVASGMNDSTSTKRARNAIEDPNQRDRYLKDDKLSVDSKERAEECKKETIKFADTLVNECKENFLDIKIDLESIYKDLNIKYCSILNELQSEINKKLSEKLHITFENIEYYSTDYSSALNFSSINKNGNIGIEYVSEGIYKDNFKWYNPFTWFKDKEKVDEKRRIQINPKDIIESIKGYIESNTTNFKDAELKRHKESIEHIYKESIDRFEIFKEAQHNEINKILSLIESSEKNIESIQNQLKDFEILSK